MRSGKVSESDAKTLKEIYGLINARAEWYGGALIQTALVQKDQGNWVNFFTIVSLVHKSTQALPKRCLDYGSLTILEAPLEVEEGIMLLRKLVEQGELATPELPSIPLEGTFIHLFDNNYLHSRNEQFSVEWPTNLYTFDADQGFKGIIPSGIMVAKNLPLYPHSFNAIQNELGVDLQRYTGLQNKVLFLLPNYAARISHVKIGKTHLSVNVQTLETNLSDLLGKLYVEYSAKSETTEFPFVEDTTDIPLRERPSQIWLYLLNKKKGDILDFRRVRMNWGRPSSQEGVTLDITLDDLQEIIQQGENETVEFKLQVKGKDPSGDEFVETVVAMANGQGGIIVVGVDDDRNVAGVKNASNTKKAVENLIRHRCDPVPQYSVDTKNVDEKSIVLVNIFSGTNRPYLVRGKGPYIRVLSNDYSPLRHELDELTKGNNITRLL